MHASTAQCPCTACVTFCGVVSWVSSSHSRCTSSSPGGTGSGQAGVTPATPWLRASLPDHGFLLSSTCDLLRCVTWFSSSLQHVHNKVVQPKPLLSACGARLAYNACPCSATSTAPVPIQAQEAPQQGEDHGVFA